MNVETMTAAEYQAEMERRFAREDAALERLEANPEAEDRAREAAAALRERYQDEEDRP